MLNFETQWNEIESKIKLKSNSNSNSKSFLSERNENLSGIFNKQTKSNFFLSYKHIVADINAETLDDFIDKKLEELKVFIENRRRNTNPSASVTNFISNELVIHIEKVYNKKNIKKTFLFEDNKYYNKNYSEQLLESYRQSEKVSNQEELIEEDNNSFKFMNKLKNLFAYLHEDYRNSNNIIQEDQLILEN